MGSSGRLSVAVSVGGGAGGMVGPVAAEALEADPSGQTVLMPWDEDEELAVEDWEESAAKASSEMYQVM